MSTLLFVPQAPGQRKHRPQIPASAVDTNAYGYQLVLNDVRNASCYKTLRGVIETVFLLIKLLLILSGVGGAIVAVLKGPDWFSGLLSICAAILSVLLTHALHQAALLLVDIADCSIRTVFLQRQKALLDAAVAER